jgi:hypothetical protein
VKNIDDLTVKLKEGKKHECLNNGSTYTDAANQKTG